MPEYGSRGLATDVAAGIALTSFVLVFAVYMPLIGFFGSFLIPLPVLFYRAKLGRRPGAIVPGAVLVAMIAMAGGVTVDVVFFFEMLLLGFTLSELFEIRLTVERTLLYAVAVVLGTGGIGLVLYSNVAGVGIGTLVAGYIAKNLQLTLALYQGMGVSDENLQMLSRSLDRIQYVLVRLTPALAVVSTLFVAWGNLLLARPLFARRRLSYPDFGALTRWQAPEQLIWGIIASGLMLLIPSATSKIIGLNGLLILLSVYFFQGLAIVAYYFEKKQVPRMFRLALYCLIALQQVFLIVVVGLGFFDMWANFRKLENKNNG